MDYEKLNAAIRAAPMTQIPALMIACIETGIDKNVWRQGWIDVFAARVEREYRSKQAADKET